MTWVTLTPIEIEFCDWLGIERNRIRNATGSKHTNNRKVTPAEELAGHILGTRTECAGKTFLWMTRWRIELVSDVSALGNLPDLEHPRGNTDVKGITRHHHQLVSPAKAIKPDWFYLLISAQEHPRYWLRGWCRGEDLARAPVKQLQPRRFSHALWPNSPILRPPQELFDHLQSVAG
jgi:hypothetical protein